MKPGTVLETVETELSAEHTVWVTLTHDKDWKVLVIAAGPVEAIRIKRVRSHILDVPLDESPTQRVLFHDKGNSFRLLTAGMKLHVEICNISDRDVTAYVIATGEELPPMDAS